MYVKFWGTRGSIPAPLTADRLQQKIRRALVGAVGLDLNDPAVVERYLERLPFAVQWTVGGNTHCIEIRSGDQLLILDAGSGVRLLGLDLMRQGFGRGGGRADFLISHSHWDHIQGFPFFVPAFIPGNHFTFHSPFVDMEDRLNKQQLEAFFPVSTAYMSAVFDFNLLTADQWCQIGRFRVYPMRLSPAGMTYGYRIEAGESCLVFASDGEDKYLDRQSAEPFVEFFREADLLIFDAHYSLSEGRDRSDWERGSPAMGAELARRANVKRLALFHHDPASDDEMILAAREAAETYLRRARPNGRRCEVLVAYDGLSLEI